MVDVVWYVIFAVWAAPAVKPFVTRYADHRPIFIISLPTICMPFFVMTRRIAKIDVSATSIITFPAAQFEAFDFVLIIVEALGISVCGGYLPSSCRYLWKQTTTTLEGFKSMWMKNVKSQTADCYPQRRPADPRSNPKK